MKTKNSGFTLIEVMVAVGVIAIALPALIMSMMEQVDGTAYLRDKLQAQWVAENVLEEMRIQNRIDGSVPDAAKSGTEELAGRKWLWQSRSKAFDDEKLKDIFGIEVSVWASKDEKAKDQAPLFKLVGIVRKFKPEAVVMPQPEVLP